MLIAVSTQNDRKVLILGLQEENIKRLMNDEPIYKNLKVEIQGLEDLENWDLAILGPEDTVRFIAQNGRLV